MPSTALFTDRYELTMVQAALRSGVAGVPCVFEVFCRRLPAGRRYGVFAGLERVVDAVESFRFGDAELAAIRSFIDEPTCRWLSSYRFRGSIEAYREGEVFFPGSPVLTVEAPFADAVMLETLVLSIVNFDSAVASAASRMRNAAGDRPLAEMGSRRVHEEAAVAAARAAYIGGIGATSNLAAGAAHGIPTMGTAAHAFVLVHGSEREAFEAQVASLGPETTLLVDTFDVEAGIRLAVEVAGPRLGGIRIDSGDLAAEARRARALLDALGNTETKILVSGDVDEFVIASLDGAPVDAFGVGTSVVTGSGAPTAGFVYKLVERDGVPVAKLSEGKATVGGRKRAYRLLDRGRATAELVTTGPAPPSQQHRPLQVPVMHDGRVLHRPPLADAAAHHRRAVAELPPEARALTAGGPAIPVVNCEPEV